MALVLFLCLCVLPVLLGFGYSLLSSLGVVGIRTAGGLATWSEVLLSQYFWTSVAFSLGVATVVVGASVLLAMFSVFIFLRRYMESYLLYLIYLPLSVAPVALAFYVYILFSPSGYLSRAVYSLLGIERADFPRLVYDPWGIGIMLAVFVPCLSFFIIWYYQQWKIQRLSDFEVLGRSMGAGRWQLFVTIILPIWMRKSSSPILIYWMLVLGMYEIPLLIGRQYPQMFAVEVVSRLWRFNLADIPQAHAMSVVYMTLVAVLFIIFGLGRLSSNRV